ncbi:MAG: hypothetical protein O3A20_04045 [Planctomycetota bacterium]|nr:hypothetical protein [Planctomycetota bacterium]
MDDVPATKPKRSTSFFAAIGLQFLAAVPVALYQAIAELHSILMLPLGLPVLTGGRSAVHLFESTVDAVSGDRRDTMLDHAWWFFSISATQTILIALLLAWRRRRCGTFREPVTFGALFFVMVNAALAADWPWWGT